MPGISLTREEARTRTALLHVDDYRIELDLSDAPRGGVFRSATTVKFSANRPGTSSFIDLVAPSVHSVTLNGTELDPDEVYADGRIALPGLAPQNELRVVADCAYSNSGEGLHRFVDPADQQTYLYTQFEVPDARRVFASFDQPDLKASFRFTVTAPAGWQLIGNEVAAPAVPGPAAGTEVHRFAPTPRISTYVTALIAGPYEGVFAEYTSADGRERVSLGVYCRPSLHPYLDADAIFEVTRQGFDYFREKFDQPYPFSKYDQLFVPAFNAGAMENAGAVTIRDQYVFRSKVTASDYQLRAETILHELAHMWFGDLVTMEWWNDLWLNESFATYTSVLCQSDAQGSRWPEAWTTFANSMKTEAYRQDQLPSTHPIVAEINDLPDVLVNFDGITYEKGASVLRQLVAYVGQEAFFQGVRAYFKQHAWGNTRLADLLSALEASSGRDLAAWSAAWLETAGVNVLLPEIETDERGRMTRLAVRQEAPPLPAGARGAAVLRPHRIAIGMYDLAEGALVRTGRIELDVQGALTEVPLETPLRRPAVLLLNDGDLTYAKIRLDPVSLAGVTAHLADFADSLPRALCWAAAWDMTRDGEMATRDYARLVLRGIGREPDITVVQTQQRQLKLALDHYAAPEWREEGLVQYSDAALRLLGQAAPGSDHQLAWAQAFASVARTDEQVDVLCGLLSGDFPLAGLSVDAELRWALIERLSALGAAGESLIDAELSSDPTASGERHAAICRAALPTAEAKEAAWAAVLDGQTLTNTIQEAVIAGFNQPDQRDLLAPYAARYFAAITDVFAQRSHQMAQQIIIGLYPSSRIEQATLDATDAWLAAADPPPGLRRPVVEARDAVERGVRAHAVDRAAGLCGP